MLNQLKIISRSKLHQSTKTTMTSCYKKKNKGDNIDPHPAQIDRGLKGGERGEVWWSCLVCCSKAWDFCGVYLCKTLKIKAKETNFHKFEGFSEIHCTMYWFPFVSQSAIIIRPFNWPHLLRCEWDLDRDLLRVRRRTFSFKKDKERSIIYNYSTHRSQLCWLYSFQKYV